MSDDPAPGPETPLDFDPADPLDNPRHEKFVLGLIEGMPAGAAYLAAGYDTSPEDAASQASRLLSTNSKIAARLYYLKSVAAARAVERVAIDKQWVLDRLADNALMCLGIKPVKLSVKVGRAKKDRKTGEWVPPALAEMEMKIHEPAGANRALELLGKEFGAFAEKAGDGNAASADQPRTVKDGAVVGILDRYRKKEAKAA